MYFLTKKIDLPFIIFESTSKCNLSCLYCYNHWKRENEKNPELNSFNMAIKTLKRLYSIAYPQNITISGGEPLLAERVNEIVLFCRMKKSNVSIITNGTIVEKSSYDQLINLGVNLFELPLHSYKKEEHNKMTNSKDSFDKTVETINYLISKGVNVVVVIIITKINYKSLEETLNYCLKIGIKKIMLNRFNIGGNGIKFYKELLLTKEELNSTFKIADNFAKKKPVFITSNVCTPYCIIEPEKFKNIFFTKCAVNSSNKALTLDIAGNIRICNHSPFILGNIFKQSLQNILKNEYINEWINYKPEECQNCKEYDQCLGGCRAASEQFYGSNKYIDPVVKLFDK